MGDQEAGPRLEVGALGELLRQLPPGDEITAKLVDFTDSRVTPEEFEGLNQSDVDGSDGVAVVVEETDRGQAGVALDDQLFLHDLTARGRGERVEEPRLGALSVRTGGVDRVDVSANSDGELVVEASLASALRALEEEDLLAAGHEGVRDDLLQRRRPLGVLALHEEPFLLDAALEALAGELLTEGGESVGCELREDRGAGNDEDEFHGGEGRPAAELRSSGRSRSGSRFVAARGGSAVALVHGLGGDRGGHRQPSSKASPGARSTGVRSRCGTGTGAREPGALTPGAPDVRGGGR